jgi:putative Mg2+ transporter-C (MgtC) family protein
MNIDVSIWEAALRLALAVLLGGFIGVEREHSGKAAGLRTNMMVCLGAAAFTLMADAVVSSASTDPTRIITGVATGIGFLGAGAILKSSAGVQGITTAAAIWVGGAVGAACGVGSYLVAIMTTIMALVVLAIVGKLEKRSLKAASPQGRAPGSDRS